MNLSQLVSASLLSARLIDASAKEPIGQQAITQDGYHQKIGSLQQVQIPGARATNEYSIAHFGMLRAKGFKVAFEPEHVVIDHALPSKVQALLQYGSGVIKASQPPLSNLKRISGNAEMLHPSLRPAYIADNTYQVPLYSLKKSGDALVAENLISGKVHSLGQFDSLKDGKNFDPAYKQFASSDIVTSEILEANQLIQAAATAAIVPTYMIEPSSISKIPKELQQRMQRNKIVVTISFNPDGGSIEIGEDKIDELLGDARRARLTAEILGPLGWPAINIHGSAFSLTISELIPDGEGKRALRSVETSKGQGSGSGQMHDRFSNSLTWSVTPHYLGRQFEGAEVQVKVGLNPAFALNQDQKLAPVSIDCSPFKGPILNGLLFIQPYALVTEIQGIQFHTFAGNQEMQKLATKVAPALIEGNADASRLFGIPLTDITSKIIIHNTSSTNATVDPDFPNIQHVFSSLANTFSADDIRITGLHEAAHQVNFAKEKGFGTLSSRHLHRSFAWITGSSTAFFETVSFEKLTPEAKEFFELISEKNFSHTTESGGHPWENHEELFASLTTSLYRFERTPELWKQKVETASLEAKKFYSLCLVAYQADLREAPLRGHPEIKATAPIHALVESAISALEAYGAKRPAAY